MNIVQIKRKFALLTCTLFFSGLFSCQSALATDSETDWFAIRGTNPFLLLHDNSSPTYWWYLWQNRSNMPTNSVGLGYYSGSDYIFPFIIEQDTPVNSLYIDEYGRIGIGHNTPAEELHVTGRAGSLIGIPNPAVLRLTGYGFGLVGTLTSWDINGHNTSFGIEDVTAGHEVFKIEGGAGENTLVLKSTGGVTSDWSGTQSGGDGLKNLMTLTAENADASKSSDAGFAMKNVKADFQWNFRTAEFAEGFMATKSGSGGPELQISNATSDYTQVSMELGNGASCTSTGQWVSASSRDYKENIKALSSNEVMTAFKQLKPVSYNFKKDANKEKTIGFIAEDVPALVATDDRKGLSSLEIVTLLTKVVQEQQAQIEAQQMAIQAQQKEIRQLVDKFHAPQGTLPPSATLTGWQPMYNRQVPGSL